MKALEAISLTTGGLFLFHGGTYESLTISFVELRLFDGQSAAGAFEKTYNEVNMTTIKSIISKIKSLWPASNLKGETIKYFVRFGLVFLVVAPILYFYRGPDSIRIIFYKISQVFLGVACAEVIWAVFFKPYFGISENMSNEGKNSSMVFRGLLYAGIIIAFCLGL